MTDTTLPQAEPLETVDVENDVLQALGIDTVGIAESTLENLDYHIEEAGISVEGLRTILDLLDSVNIVRDYQSGVAHNALIQEEGNPAIRVQSLNEFISTVRLDDIPEECFIQAIELVRGHPILVNRLELYQRSGPQNLTPIVTIAQWLDSGQSGETVVELLTELVDLIVSQSDMTRDVIKRYGSMKVFVEFCLNLNFDQARFLVDRGRTDGLFAVDDIVREEPGEPSDALERNRWLVATAIVKGITGGEIVDNFFQPLHFSDALEIDQMIESFLPRFEDELVSISDPDTVARVINASFPTHVPFPSGGGANRLLAWKIEEQLNEALKQLVEMSRLYQNPEVWKLQKLRIVPDSTYGVTVDEQIASADLVLKFIEERGLEDLVLVRNVEYARLMTLSGFEIEDDTILRTLIQGDRNALPHRRGGGRFASLSNLRGSGLQDQLRVEIIRRDLRDPSLTQQEATNICLIMSDVAWDQEPIPDQVSVYTQTQNEVSSIGPRAVEFQQQVANILGPIGQGEDVSRVISSLSSLITPLSPEQLAAASEHMRRLGSDDLGLLIDGIHTKAGRPRFWHAPRENNSGKTPEEILSDILAEERSAADVPAIEVEETDVFETTLISKSWERIESTLSIYTERRSNHSPSEYWEKQAVETERGSDIQKSLESISSSTASIMRVVPDLVGLIHFRRTQVIDGRVYIPEPLELLTGIQSQGVDELVRIAEHLSEVAILVEDLEHDAASHQSFRANLDVLIEIVGIRAMYNLDPEMIRLLINYSPETLREALTIVDQYVGGKYLITPEHIEFVNQVFLVNQQLSFYHDVAEVFNLHPIGRGILIRDVIREGDTRVLHKDRVMNALGAYMEIATVSGRSIPSLGGDVMSGMLHVVDLDFISAVDTEKIPMRVSFAVQIARSARFRSMDFTTEHLIGVATKICKMDSALLDDQDFVENIDSYWTDLQDFKLDELDTGEILISLHKMNTRYPDRYRDFLRAIVPSMEIVADQGLQRFNQAMDLIAEIFDSQSLSFIAIAPQVIAIAIRADNPVEAFNQLKSVMLSPGYMQFEKLYRIYEIQHSEAVIAGLKNSMPEGLAGMSKEVLDQYARGKLVVLLIDSGNREVLEFMQGIHEFAKALHLLATGGPDDFMATQVQFLNIKRIQVAFSQRDIQVGDGSNLVDTVFCVFQAIMPNGELPSSYDETEELLLRFLYGEDFPFGGYQAARESIKERTKVTDERNRSLYRNVVAGAPLVRVGDLLKGTDSYYFASDLINSGVRTKNLLGAFSPGSDATPFDADFSEEIESHSTIAESIDDSLAKSYGDIILVVRDRGQLSVPNDGDEVDDLVAKNAIVQRDAQGARHRGILGGIGSMEIDAIVIKRKLSDETEEQRRGLAFLKYSIARQGFFIPIFDLEGNEVFSPEEYDQIRKQFIGVDIVNLYPEIEESESSTEHEERVDQEMATLAKEEEQVGYAQEVLLERMSTIVRERGLELSTYSDEQFASRAILFNTGSTSRQSNMPGDFDYDLTLYVHPSRIPELIKAFREEFGGEPNVYSKGKRHQMQFFGIQIGEGFPEIDLDIGLVDISLSINGALYSHQAVERRYAALGPEASRRAKVEVIMGKKHLKEHGAYGRKQGVFGGIGLECWVLSSGGSLLEAFRSFYEAAHSGHGGEQIALDEMKSRYPIWNPGINLADGKPDHYMDDINEEGYAKLIVAVKNYLVEVGELTE